MVGADSAERSATPGSALWPALELAQSLVAEGPGAGVLECLQRIVSVPKAATSSADERPKARSHLESLSVSKPLMLPAKITLVDDVVTRGAQLFGAAWKLWEVRPELEIRAFAVVRTISDLRGVHRDCRSVRWCDSVAQREHLAATVVFQTSRGAGAATAYTLSAALVSELGGPTQYDSAAALEKACGSTCESRAVPAHPETHEMEPTPNKAEPRPFDGPPTKDSTGMPIA